jgi:hypothetical protein
MLADAGMLKLWLACVLRSRRRASGGVPARRAAPRVSCGFYSETELRRKHVWTAAVRERER